VKISPRLRRAAVFAWIAAVLGLVAHEAYELDWAEVANTLLSYPWHTIAVAFAIAVPGYVACASYDLVGRHCTGHGLPVARTIAISFVGYSFSLNLGAAVGGLGFRYRLYAPSDLPAWSIGQVIALSVLTNWSGYVLMAGLVFAFAPPTLPSGWIASEMLLRVGGVVLLGLCAAYLGFCTRKGGERIEVRGQELVVPSLAVAGVQLALSLVSWSAIAGVIAWLLPDGIGFFEVMPVVLISAIAGVLSHVPGGFGVIEFVFAALLGHAMSEPRLVAALLVFRATYYMAPFVIALATYAYLEATSDRPSAQASPA
jgi:uncharacterized membrane protein YbhN (UPF0104 family)